VVPGKWFLEDFLNSSFQFSGRLNHRAVVLEDVFWRDQRVMTKQSWQRTHCWWRSTGGERNWTGRGNRSQEI